MQVLTVNNMPVEDGMTYSSSIGSERSNHYTIPVCREEEAARIHHNELEMISYINEKLSLLNVISGAIPPQFNMDSKGHFCEPMDYQYYKHHEEDFVVVVLEAMEMLGWYFRFQYDVVFGR